MKAKLPKKVGPYINRGSSLAGMEGIKVITKEKIEQKLPKEWLELVKEAMHSNVTIEEFKKFIEERTKH